MSALDASPTKKPTPTPTPETEYYWAGCRDGELRIQRCNACSQYYFYPRPSCAHCASSDVSWVRASGRATLHTYLISHRAAPGFEDNVPYAIAVVQLEEGPRMMSNIVGIDNTPENLILDMDLEVTFENRGAQSVPVFRPAGAS